MHIQALKTHPIQAGEVLFDILDTYVPPLKERSILVITSKIVSLCEGRVVPKKDVLNKFDLIQQEADAVLKPRKDSPHKVYLTLTNNILIPSAGIDESNGNGCYILYPQDIQATASLIWHHLRKINKIKNLGILITDSHTTPLRRGVTGIALGWCGFSPLYNYIGKPDIFGHELCVTKINNLDALAASAVFIMGEGDEQTPLALITDLPRIEFLLRPPSAEEIQSMKISLQEDLYAPLLESKEWVWKR